MHVLPAAVFGLPEWAGRLVLVGIIIVGTIAVLAVVGWLMHRLRRRARDYQGPRAKQRQTAVTALATGLRYAVLVCAAIAIIGAVSGGGGFAAIGGGALIVIVAGFASQRLLVDIIAGFFILFEDQYGVGDVIRIEPFGYIGRVESLGLRTTVLRGDAPRERLIVPNGNITAVRILPEGLRPFRLDLLTFDADAVEAVVREVAGGVSGAGGPWRSMPRLVRREASPGLTRVIAVVDIDATREDAAQWLADAVAQRAGDLLAAAPLLAIDPGR